MRNILCRDGIRLNCTTCSKEEAIQRAGELLAELGYVEEEYVNAMFRREEEYDTYLGNGVAIPHGCLGSEKYIRESGIVLCQYRESICYNENSVHLVLGIAGKDNTHLDILGQIAVVLSNPDNVKKIVMSDSKEEIIQLLEMDEEDA